MNTKAKRSGKMGRPPSGNRAFCIRMKPNTHDDLLRASQKDGYERLGEWLDDRPVEVLFKLSNPARLKNPAPARLNAAFQEYAKEIALALGEMRLIVERNHMLDDDEENLKAFKRMKWAYYNLMRRLASIDRLKVFAPRF
ncbi:MAG TPA: hypothetical protein VGR14_16865 [Verrucomicrobiae bacterium]|nr:hypothetical protein [Verrucomicrobiae bacterium]